jgi:hypothetical protein
MCEKWFIPTLSKTNLREDASNGASSFFGEWELKTTYLPQENQPLTSLFSHLAAYITAHHTYFTGCETKNTARAGFTKGIVNTPLPLVCN